MEKISKHQKDSRFGQFLKYFKVPKRQQVWSILKKFQSAREAAGLVDIEKFQSAEKAAGLENFDKKRSEGPEHKALAPHSKNRGKNQRLLPFTPV